MEDLIQNEVNRSVKAIVKDMNAKRLENKDKWIMNSYPIIDVPEYSVRIKYKMYNTWVQILELEIIEHGNKITHRDDSPMDLKPRGFKPWLEDALKRLFRLMRYDNVTS